MKSRRRYSSKVGGVGAGLARQAAQFVMVVDAAGELQRVRVATDAPVGLLGALLARSGVPGAPSDAARVVAKVWHEVTDGAGVVLDAAGNEVKP